MIVFILFCLLVIVSDVVTYCDENGVNIQE